MLRYLQALILDKIKGLKILCITVIAGLKAINSAMVKVQLTDLQSKSYHDNELQLLQGIFLIFKLLCHTNSTIFFFRIRMNSNNREGKILLRKETMQKSFTLLVEENAFFLAVMEKAHIKTYLFQIYSCYTFPHFPNKKKCGAFCKRPWLERSQFLSSVF